MRDRTVLISGAGIAGPSLAYWLLQYGFVPTIVEQAPAFRTGGYMIDFWGVGYDVAERMGLLPTLRRDGYRLEEVRTVDRRGRRVSAFKASVFEKAAPGGRFLSILRGDLAYRIYELVEHQVETIFRDSVTAVAAGDASVDVAFERASSRRFDLVVGADGLHSNIRRLAFGARPADEHYLGYYCAAFTIDGYPHRDEGIYMSFAAPGKQIARYALRGGRSAFFMMMAQDSPVDIRDRDVAAQRAFLHERFDGGGWESEEILAAMDRADDLYFDAVAQVRLDAWTRGRVALLGDAAYCPSLLAGQGSAFAVAGAYVLATALAKSGGVHGLAFSEYERTFKPFIEGKQRAAENFAGWFAPRTKLGLGVRNAVTNILNLPLVSDLMAKRMFGDQFDLPARADVAPSR